MSFASIIINVFAYSAKTNIKNEKSLIEIESVLISKTGNNMNSVIYSIELFIDEKQQKLL